MASWFQKCLPRIKDIKPLIKIMAEDFKSLNGVKNIYVWGSYSKNIKNLDYRIKDIDILFKTSFHSGDLMALDKESSETCLTVEELENQGFDPNSVIFSKKINSFKNFDIDPWAISSDKKLLHWGPIMDTVSDSQYIIKQAENHACEKIGIKIKKLQKSSETIRKSWYQNYEEYLQEYFDGMPHGWYRIENIKTIKDITEKTIEL